MSFFVGVGIGGIIASMAWNLPKIITFVKNIISKIKDK